MLAVQKYMWQSSLFMVSHPSKDVYRHGRSGVSLSYSHYLI